MMKWSRFFRTVGFLIVFFAAFLALLWYGQQLDASSLLSVAAHLIAISSLALFLAILIPFVKQRWWRRPMDERLVRQRLGAFYYVFWGVLFLNITTHLAISHRALEIELDYTSSPMIELNRLYHAMSSVSITLIFACFLVMIRFLRYVHDEGAEANADQ